MLPALPGPGSPQFPKLVKDLHSFGILPADVIVDAPTNKLSDLVLMIGLLERRVIVRITAELFELNVNSLFEGDDPHLISIAGAVFSALSEIDADSKKGIALIRSTTHLSLNPQDLNQILAEYLSGRIAGLEPETIVYRVSLPKMAKGEDVRLVFSKSVVFDNSLFVDISTNYRHVDDLTDLAEQANLTFEAALGLLGLREKSAENGERI